MKAKHLLVLATATCLKWSLVIASNPTDYFRSAQDGNWNQVMTWESSADNIVWTASDMVPTNSATSITIRAPNTVTIDVNANAQFLTVDAGAVLVHPSNSIGFTIYDGPNTEDFIIDGRYELNGTMPLYNGVTPRVSVHSGGEVRVNANAAGLSDDFARDAHVYFNTDALFSWYTTSPFETVGTTYFPNATLADKAIFRINDNVLSLGSNSSTTFNGKFEVADGYTTTFQFDGVKIFRDGLGGGGTIIQSATSGPFRITSPTAIMDGSLQIDLQHVESALEIVSGSMVTVSGNPSIYHGTLVVDGILNANGSLTLKSDAVGTARVGISTGTINGDVTIERYIPANRAWRFLTAPFATSTQTINAAWQEGNTNTTLDCPTQYPGASGYGTEITYNGSNGYDVNTTQNPSIYLWDNAWVVPASTTGTLITDYSAYCIFVRGDRTICLSQGVGAGANPTTLRAIGNLNQTTGVAKMYSGLTPGQFIFVGNPYASSIDMTNVLARSTGIDPNVFWLWDPGYGVNGGYVTYFNNTISPQTTNYPDAASALIIQSGQGFFLKVSASSAVVSFQESDKTPIESSVFARIRYPELHASLNSLSTSTPMLVDGVAAQFDMSGGDGASKSSNNFENIYLARSGKRFAIESRSLPVVQSDTLFLEMNGMKSEQYVLDVHANDLFAGNESALLQDNLLGTEMPLRGDTLAYPFVVDLSDTTTFKRRFWIVCSPIRDTAFVHHPLTIYPNPMRSVLSIKGLQGSPMVRITDISGRVMLHAKSFFGSINCSFLKNGMYFLTVGNTTIKFIKQ